MENIGGAINDILVLGVFIYSALLLHGKVNYPSPKVQDKINSLKEKKISFIVVWVGVLCFSLLTIKWFL